MQQIEDILALVLEELPALQVNLDDPSTFHTEEFVAKLRERLTRYFLDQYLYTF